MRTFNENTFNQEWVDYWTILTELGLASYFNEDELSNAFKKAPAALTEDTGLAYPGALLSHIRLSTLIAERLCKIMSGTFNIDITSLRKVCCLMHLSKIDMFIPNDNDWEISKRGMNYKFAQLEGCLKAGERSALNACNLGIKFTPIEYESMKALDKDADEFNSGKYYNNIMTVIIRQANDLAYLVAKEKYNKK